MFVFEFLSVLCCSGRMGEQRQVYKGLMESPKERDHSEDQGVDGSVRSECILRDWLGADLIRLAHDKNRWRAVVNAVMNLWVLGPRSCVVLFR
jgi:hypothetical protein